MEPSGPTLRVQLDGQPVVPAAFGNDIRVEFENVAVLVSLRLSFQYAVRSLLGNGTVVAMLKGMVTTILQASANERNSDHMAMIGLH